MGKRGGKNCCVPLCPNYWAKCPPGTEWFSFPKDAKYKKIWLIKIRRDAGNQFQVTRNTRICSHHFVPFDKFPRNALSKISRLKPTAIPSIFPWREQQNEAVLARDLRQVQRNASNNSAKQQSQQQQKQQQRRKRQLQQKQLPLQEQKKSPEAEITSDDANNDGQQLNTTESSQITWEAEKQEVLKEMASLKAQNGALQRENARLRAKKMEIQVENTSLKNEISSLKQKFITTEKQVLRYENIRKDDKLVKFYTGFLNNSWFTSFLKYLYPRYTHLSYWYGKVTNTKNTKKHTTGLPSKLNARNMLFLVLLRLRLGMPITEIGRLFGISLTTVTRIFTTWITFLYFELRELFPIPPISAILKARPQQFSNYPDVTIIIDCTEIRIQKPSKLAAQRQTFSNYKHFNTYKFLLGITPGGLVCFVSPLFGGAASDKHIVVESNFLEMLCPGHGIMADKGFDILDVLPDDISLNVPPKFMKSRDGQMPVADVIETRKIASVRVHVERAIARIKSYRILATPIPLAMHDIADQVVTVSAFLTNFKPALLKSNA